MAPKRRPAAALTLLTWYLIVPPILKGGVISSKGVDHWKVVATFESESACRRAARSMRFDGFNSSLVATSRPSSLAEAMQKEEARCLPRAPSAKRETSPLSVPNADGNGQR